MKIAISSDQTTLEGAVCPRFGRTKFFLVYDMETGSVEVVQNTQNLNAAQGAGIQAAQNVAGAGAEAVITGHCGPKAFRTLKAAGVRIYLDAGSLTITDAIETYKKGEFTEAETADVEGHWV